jgi:hypothetical protein
LKPVSARPCVDLGTFNDLTNSLKSLGIHQHLLSGLTTESVGWGLRSFICPYKTNTVNDFSSSGRKNKKKKGYEGKYEGGERYDKTAASTPPCKVYVHPTVGPF